MACASRASRITSLVALISLAGVGASDPTRAVQSTVREEVERALELYASGSIDEAVGELAELERRAVETPRVERQLRRARSRLVVDVGQASRFALLPLAFLEQRLAAAHAENDDEDSAELAEERAASLAETFLQTTGENELAAKLFASLAGLIHQRSLELQAEPLYRRALDLDRELPAALLGLAAVEEKRGRLPAAGSLLARSLAAAPDEREVQLRSALVAARLDDAQTALDGLDRLVDGGGDDWIAALAYQERAALLAAAGRLDEALDCARAGMTAIPCDPSLPMVVSYYAERVGAADFGLGETLAACTDETPVSPRALYNRRPQTFFDELRRRLEEVEHERLRSLAAVLADRAGR